MLRATFPPGVIDKRFNVSRCSKCNLIAVFRFNIYYRMRIFLKPGGYFKNLVVYFLPRLGTGKE